jgi:hypothetical protein
MGAFAALASDLRHMLPILAHRFAALAARLFCFLRGEFMCCALFMSGLYLLAISRCRSSSIDPKPRLELSFSAMVIYSYKNVGIEGFVKFCGPHETFVIHYVQVSCRQFDARDRQIRLRNLRKTSDE